MIETPANLKASYGHDVECSWLVFDAARALGQPLAIHRGWAETLCGYSLKYGYDKQRGGFFYTGSLGKPAEDTRKEWWVQAEALVAMLEMYRLIGKQEYYTVFSKTLDFVQKYQVAAEGSWWATRSADGSPQGNSRTSTWQGAYHNGRAMLLCASRCWRNWRKRSRMGSHADFVKARRMDIFVRQCSPHAPREEFHTRSVRATLVRQGLHLCPPYLTIPPR